MNKECLQGEKVKPGSRELTQTFVRLSASLYGMYGQYPALEPKNVDFAVGSLNHK